MEMKIDMTESGKRLRELRGCRTRRGVSRETGIPYSSLEAYENGTRKPAERVKKILADYYHCEKKDIFLPVETAKKSK